MILFMSICFQPSTGWLLQNYYRSVKAHIVTTEHSTNNKRRNGKFWGFVDRFVYNRYDKIIACADKALELFQKQYPTLDSCFVPNGCRYIKILECGIISKVRILNE